MSRRPLFVLLGLLALLALGFTLLWNLTQSPSPVAPAGNTALASAPDAGSKASEPAALEALREEQPVDRKVVEKEAEKQPAKRAEAGLTPAEAELAAGQWVEGHVKLPEGTPADERISIEARGRKFSNGTLHSAAVDSNGNFRVAFSKDTKTGWLRLKGRYAYLTVETQVKLPLKADAPKKFELEPALGGCMRGKLVLPASAVTQGTSLAGTRIQAWRMFDQAGDENNVNRNLATEIAADQTFEFGGASDKGGWSVYFESESFTRVQKEVRVEAGRISDIELTLKLGARLTGKLVDEDRQPVAGATFSYQSLSADGNNWSNFRGKKSGDDGAFDLKAAPAGKGTLTIEKEGFLYEEHKFEALVEGEERPGLEIVLRRGNAVAGVVQWQDGKPVAEAQVSIHYEEERGEGSMRWNNGRDQTLKTDAAGKFRFTGLGKANATLRAEAKPPEATKMVEASSKEGAEPAAAEEEPNKAKDEAKDEDKPAAKESPKSKSSSKTDKRRKWTAHEEDIAPGTQNVVLLLTSGYAVQGRVVDSSGTPVKEFLVRAEPVEKDRNEWESVRGAVTRRFADEAGRFNLDGLHEGEWKVSAEAKNMPASSAQQIKVPGQAAALELKLAAAASASGLVVDPSGAPAKSAKVRAEVSRERQSRFVIGGDKKYSDTVDAAGKFEITGIPAGPAKLFASADGWAQSAPLDIELAPGQKLEDLRIALRRPGRIAGLVLDPAGHPDVGRPVSTNGHESGSGWQQTTTDANGRFSFEKLSPGEYQVYTQVKSEEQAAVQDDQEKLNRLWQEQQRSASVKVEEGATAELTLGGAPKNALHLVGHVTCAGKALAGCYLNTWKQSRGEGEQQQFHATSLADGSYDLTLDGEGEYSVNLTPSGASTQQNFMVKVSAEARQTRDFELSSCRLAGRVVDRAGKPQAQVWITLQGDSRARGGGERNSSGNANTDDEGRFVFEHVAPGVYELACGGENMGWRSGNKQVGRSTLSGLKLEAGKSLEGLELVLQPACRVEGSVIGLDGAPVAGARVYAVDEQGKLLTGWSESKTDGSGHFSFDALPPVRAAFAAKKGKLASPLSSFVQVREGETTKVDLALSNGTSIFVQAVDADGKNVGADIQVFDAHGVDQSWLMYWDQGKSGVENLPGRRFGPLAPGKYTVVVMRKDKPDVRQEVSVAGEESKAVSVRCE